LKEINVSKTKLYADAEKLFLYERMSPEDIAEHLQVSRRAVYYWKKKFNWDKKLAKTIQNNQFFSTELQEFILNLIKTIEKNIDNKEPTNSAMLYSVINMLKNLPELQKYEQAVKQEKRQQKFELTPEYIKQIQKDILGWEPND